MKVCKIKWSPNCDETTIIFSDDYDLSDWIVKADILKDAIRMLVDEYQSILPSNNIK